MSWNIQLGKPLKSVTNFVCCTCPGEAESMVPAVKIFRQPQLCQSVDFGRKCREGRYCTCPGEAESMVPAVKIWERHHQGRKSNHFPQPILTVFLTGNISRVHFKCINCNHGFKETNRALKRDCRMCTSAAYCKAPRKTKFLIECPGCTHSWTCNLMKRKCCPHCKSRFTPGFRTVSIFQCVLCSGDNQSNSSSDPKEVCEQCKNEDSESRDEIERATREENANLNRNSENFFAADKLTFNFNPSRFEESSGTPNHENSTIEESNGPIFTPFPESFQESITEEEDMRRTEEAYQLRIDPASIRPDAESEFFDLLDQEEKEVEELLQNEVLLLKEERRQKEEERKKKEEEERKRKEEEERQRREAQRLRAIQREEERKRKQKEEERIKRLEEQWRREALLRFQKEREERRRIRNVRNEFEEKILDDTIKITDLEEQIRKQKRLRLRDKKRFTLKLKARKKEHKRMMKINRWINGHNIKKRKTMKEVSKTSGCEKERKFAKQKCKRLKRMEMIQKEGKNPWENPEIDQEFYGIKLEELNNERNHRQKLLELEVKKKNLKDRIVTTKRNMEAKLREANRAQSQAPDQSQSTRLPPRPRTAFVSSPRNNSADFIRRRSESQGVENRSFTFGRSKKKKKKVEKKKEVKKVNVVEDDANECKICMEGTISRAYLCGHVFCEGCAKRMKKCPYCKKKVKGVIKLFM